MYYSMQKNLTNLMQMRRSKHSSNISSMVWKDIACYSSLPVPHFSICSSKDLTEALPLQILPICSAERLFSNIGVFYALFCHWQENMKLLLKISPLICIFSIFLSLPRLLKITYFHLDTQLPLGTNFFSVIDTSFLPASLISSNHSSLNLPSLS